MFAPFVSYSIPLPVPASGKRKTEYGKKKAPSVRPYRTGSFPLPITPSGVINLKRYIPPPSVDTSHGR